VLTGGLVLGARVLMFRLAIPELLLLCGLSLRESLE
jgi:hypothetical protein